MIKAVFFDLYQTLIHYTPPPEEELAKVIQEFGIEITADALRHPIAVADEFVYQENARLPISQRSQQEQKALFTTYQSMLLEAAGIDPSPELIRHNLSSIQQVNFSRVLFDDVLPSFEKLRQMGLVLGLISNVDSDISPLLARLELAPFLQVVITSQDGGYHKPQPQIFNTAAEKAGIKTEESMYVGDQYQIDVLGSKAAGMQGVLLDRNGFFTDNTQCLVVKDLNQLVKHLS